VAVEKLGISVIRQNLGDRKCPGEPRKSFKAKLAQSEIDAISRLKAKHQEIDKKVHHDLKTTGEVVVAAKVKSNIDAEIVKFKASLDQLAAKAKSQPTAATANH
jgi:hypothetical protein